VNGPAAGPGPVNGPAAGPGADDAARIDRVLGAGTAAFLALLDPDVDPTAQDPDAVRAVLAQPGARRELRETAVRNRERVDALLASLDAEDPAVLLAGAVQAGADGDTDREVALVRRGLAADPGCRLLALHAAELADDAGDAAAAVELYRRAGLDPYSTSVPLQVGLYARPLEVNVGRNAPCPCGSGRKYKTCCWRRSADWPLTLRANWVVDKLLRAAQTDPAYEDVLARRRVVVGLDDGDGGPGRDDEVVSLFLEHCVLFDAVPGGAAGSFVELVAGRRAGVYPADELALAMSWAGPARPAPALVQVDDVADGTLVLRSVARWTDAGTQSPDGGYEGGSDGGTVDVVDPAVAAAVAPGRHLLAVTVPVDDAERIVGPVLFVPPTHVGAVASAPGPDEALRRLLEG
jgi:hypothetical protein